MHAQQDRVLAPPDGHTPTGPAACGVRSPPTPPPTTATACNIIAPAAQELRRVFRSTGRHHPPSPSPTLSCTSKFQTTSVSVRASSHRAASVQEIVNVPARNILHSHWRARSSVSQGGSTTTTAATTTATTTRAALGRIGDFDRRSSASWAADAGGRHLCCPARQPHSAVALLSPAVLHSHLRPMASTR